MRNRTIALTAALLLPGCTFGTLSSSKCMELYGEAAAFALAQARTDGAVAAESYSYCADGRGRIDAVIPPLRAHGFSTVEPVRHFEVPGGWCTGGERSVLSARFDPMKSLETVCAIGDASRAYMTGGSFTSASGQRHYLLTLQEREAREEIRRRIAQPPES